MSEDILEIRAMVAAEWDRHLAELTELRATVARLEAEKERMRKLITEVLAAYADLPLPRKTSFAKAMRMDQAVERARAALDPQP